MSVTELETRIVKMQEWEQLAQDAAAEAEAIQDAASVQPDRVVTRGEVVLLVNQIFSHY